jgi:hypothetical protein
MLSSFLGFSRTSPSTAWTDRSYMLRCPGFRPHGDDRKPCSWLAGGAIRALRGKGVDRRCLAWQIKRPSVCVRQSPDASCHVGYITQLMAASSTAARSRADAHLVVRQNATTRARARNAASLASSKYSWARFTFTGSPFVRALVHRSSYVTALVLSASDCETTSGSCAREPPEVVDQL